MTAPGIIYLYGFASQYSDGKTSGGKNTGRGPAPCPEAIRNDKDDTENGVPPLDFMRFLTKGHGNLIGTRLPNTQETEEPGRVFSSGWDQRDHSNSSDSSAV
jgi:hypothetical protein